MPTTGGSPEPSSRASATQRAEFERLTEQAGQLDREAARIDGEAGLVERLATLREMVAGRLGYRLGLAVLVIAVAWLGAAGAQASPRPGEPVAPTAAGLRVLLAGAGVPLERGQHPSAASFHAAWTAFQRFARLPTERRGGDLLFEFGVFESRDYGTSFEVELTRRYADVRQVHLMVHFPVAAFIAITRDLRATPCLPGGGCTFRCFFAGDDGLVPHPCRIVPGGASGYRIGDMTLRASQAGGRARWLRGVASSPVFAALFARHVRPDGYEVWQE